MKTNVIIRGGFIPTKVQNRKQIEKAIKEVEEYDKKAKMITYFSMK